MYLLKYFCVLFLFFVSLILNQSFAGTAEKLIDQKCRTELKRTEIHVFVDRPNVAYNFERDTNQLTSMKSSGTNGTTLGLTVVRNESDIKTKVSMIKLPDGSVCMRPGFDITIKLNPQKVYVANEFKQGTCAFNQIMHHEMRHVQVNQKHAEMIAYRYEREMQKAFANKIYFGSQNVLMDGLVKVIKNDWLPHLGDEIKKAEELHKKIDTEQEYRRMGTVCNREVPRILSSYM